MVMSGGLAIETRSHFKTSTIYVILPVGSAFEKQAGITSILLEHLERDTRKMDENHFADYLDAHGMELSFNPGRTAAFFKLRVPADETKVALSLAKEVFFEQDFDDDQHSTIVQQEIAYIHQIKSSPENILKNYLKWEASYPDSIITQHPSGSPESLQEISVDNVQNHHNWLIQHRPTIVMVGPEFDTQERKLLEDFHESFGTRKPSLSSFPPKIELNSVEHPPSMNSSNLYMGVNLRSKPPVPESHAQTLYRMVIGGGLSTRLFREIREVRNLSYAPNLSSVSFPKGGFLTASMDLIPTSLEEALEVTLKGLNSVIFDRVEEAEVRRALHMAQSSFSFYTDTSSYLARFIAGRLGYDLNYDIESIKKSLVKSATSDWQSELKELWIPENLSFCSTSNGEFSDMWKEKAEVYF